ncbi:hypothetical protein HBH47_077410 [Parastagonospora nodorum]|nr:hypothetical protein HBH47_077410 [Parastagonospora nodorum]KAH6124565.1 hypothetical protein HBI69_045120 [Parastagonospora nodorum]
MQQFLSILSFLYYIGCYVANGGTAGSPELIGDYNGARTQLDPNGQRDCFYWCIFDAPDAPYNFIALENGINCLCANQTNPNVNAIKRDDRECNVVALGTTDEAGGGDNRITLFRVEGYEDPSEEPGDSPDTTTSTTDTTTSTTDTTTSTIATTTSTTATTTSTSATTTSSNTGTSNTGTSNTGTSTSTGTSRSTTGTSTTSTSNTGSSTSTSTSRSTTGTSSTSTSTSSTGTSRSTTSTSTTPTTTTVRTTTTSTTSTRTSTTSVAQPSTFF